MRFVARLFLVVSFAVISPFDAAADDDAASVPTAAKASPSAAILSYVQRVEPSFNWRLINQASTPIGSIYELRVTSQTWQGITWEHAVEIFEPPKVAFQDSALLFVTGGSKPSPPSRSDAESGLRLAAACGARVVMLHQTPNQPLLGNRKEDDLISESWLRFLDTGDKSWPLLFPMVKSAVKTMDAVEAFSKETFGKPINRFVITGASKRGWTSWLTPVADKRVIATAPIVIDVLNFRAQMNHQIETWGTFSEQIRDYTSKGLVKRPDEKESPREVELRTMMDPYTYREELTLPKLLIVGTNDPYWVVDAMNLYWDDLRGQKFIRQIPNAGHGLQGGKENALASLAVFFRHVVSGQTLPNLSWELRRDGDGVSLSMSASAQPSAVRFWTATSSDKDFRDAEWSSTSLDKTDTRWIGTASKSEGQHLAVFGEFEFESSGIPWSLTTLVFRQ